MCCSSTLCPVSRSGSRPSMAKTEFSASAKVDQIQHSYLGPEVESKEFEKLKEFKGIQSGNKENCESFVLHGCDAEFEKRR